MKKDLTVADVKELKKEAEDKILSIFKKLYDDTGCFVTGEALFTEKLSFIDGSTEQLFSKFVIELEI